jgi:hypothetical protein
VASSFLEMDFGIPIWPFNMQMIQWVSHAFGLMAISKEYPVLIPISGKYPIFQ